MNYSSPIVRCDRIKAPTENSQFRGSREKVGERNRVKLKAWAGEELEQE
jgi:hypothetical protein